MITVEFVFSFQIDKNNEFEETKSVLFSFPQRFSEDDFRVQRSFWVILAIFGHFCKTEKARIGAISWADIGSF